MLSPTGLGKGMFNWLGKVLISYNYKCCQRAWTFSQEPLKLTCSKMSIFFWFSSIVSRICLSFNIILSDLHNGYSSASSALSFMHKNQFATYVYHNFSVIQENKHILFQATLTVDVFNNPIILTIYILFGRILTYYFYRNLVLLFLNNRATLF